MPRKKKRSIAAVTQQRKKHARPAYVEGDFTEPIHTKRRKGEKRPTFQNPNDDLDDFARAVYSKRAPPGYGMIYVQDDVIAYKRGNRYVIAHRGTATKQDIVTDVQLAIGKQGDEFKDRTDLTRHIIERIRRDDPDAEIYLTGHSLGGTTANVAMRDPYINANIKKAAVYNMGSSPLFDNKLADKVDSVVIAGDPVSLFGEKTEVKVTKKSRRIPFAFMGGPLAGIASMVGVHSINEFE